MRWIGRVSMVALATAVVISGGVAGASAGKVQRHVHASPDANAPSGYAIATSMITVNGSTRAQGTATCQTGDVVLGGGAFIVSDNLEANINSSWPKNSTTWAVNVNNGDPAPSGVTIFAICAHKPTGYQQVKTATVTNPGGTKTTQIATCPKGKKVLGGGSHSNSSSLAVAETSSLPGKTMSPVRYAWGVDESNQAKSVVAPKLFTVAICGNPSGYKLETGSFVTDAGDSQQVATESCPSGTVPLGGGVSASGTGAGLSINTSQPLNNGWEVYENNNTSSDQQILPAVTCAS